jgi:hypothetical protein
VGVPARIPEKPVPEEYKAQWSEFKKVYVDLARRYPDEYRIWNRKPFQESSTVERKGGVEDAEIQ